MKQKKKMLLFNPALAPYRIDQFNKLAELFDLKIFLLNSNVPNQSFDQDHLRSQLHGECGYLLKGFNLKGRYFRFGIKQEIKKFKPDIIVGYEYSPLTVYLIWLNKALRLNAKIVSLVDDSLEICKVPQTRFRGWLRHWCLSRLDYLVLLSGEVADWYEAVKGVDRSKIIVNPLVYNPAKFTALKPELLSTAESYIKRYKLEHKKVLLYVGRLAREKGVDLLLNIMPSLVSADPSVMLVLVGGGPESDHLKALIHRKKINHAVIMPGRFERSGLYAWYLAANLFILPSIYEPFGAVVSESLLFGTPVVCSRHAGAATLISPLQNGIVVDPENEAAFTDETLAYMAENRDLFAKDIRQKKSLMPHDFDYFFQDWHKLI